ncbi:MAG: Arc family DNA-binding protein [Candidatus Riflebacteria bacterium]|nr:Arc family DNA-binding protein [Candidatus Riflebacteria bacterium]
MATITLKNVPRKIHLNIKKRAEKNHRSINGEIISCLERILGLCEEEADSILTKAEIAQKGLKFVVTQKEVQEAKIEGRK